MLRAMWQALRIGMTLGAAFFVAGCVTPPPAYRPPSAPAVTKKLPKEKFWWGTSTASFQNEDRGEPPGSPFYFQTDWDVFGKEGHAPVRGDDAVFSWSRFDRDLVALKQLGVSHFRFGVEWARIEPKPGVVNERALARYVRMARDLRAAGIEPVVTLWHFTFPDWLYDSKRKGQSNFLHPDVREAWRAHVTRVAKAMAPYVRIYVPQNEPNGALQLGWIAGHWPPGLLLRPFAYKKAMKVSADMFREAAGIVRRERPDAVIMGIYSLPDWRRNRLQDPTALVYNIVQRQNFDHLDMVADTMDVVGVNYYYAQDASILRFLSRGHGEMSSDYTQLGWEIVPEGLYNVLKTVQARYGKPIVVTENGLGTQSERKRIRYIREHIAQLRRAIESGVDVRGYFPWTLVDNYEWKEGWTGQFGLFSYDARTKDRVLEPTGKWFSAFIKEHREP
ncbi:MAG: glycoside hydrolase family 1 protein [Chthoniobacterales bacterium]|nr:glycoside hydrolase family 1 protein [Chthoniobacterales bacterium]